MTTLLFKYLKLFSVTCLLMISCAAFSQINRGTNQIPTTPEAPKEDKTDYLQLAVNKFTEDLSLDGFQQAVIKDILVVNQKAQMKIYEEDIPSISKNEKLIVLQQDFVKKIKAILNPDQIAKYDKLVEKNKKKK